MAQPPIWVVSKVCGDTEEASEGDTPVSANDDERARRAYGCQKPAQCVELIDLVFAVALAAWHREQHGVSPMRFSLSYRARSGLWM